MEKKEVEIKFTSWDSLIMALKDTYTTSFKDVCKMLKASRAWINRYVRPNVKSVYISNNRRGDANKGVDWVRLASIELGKEMTESIWFDTGDLIAFITESIVSVTKQTKSVPLDYLMTSEQAKAYIKELDFLNNEIQRVKSLRERSLLIKQRDTCHLKYLPEDNATKELLQQKMSVTKRTKAVAVSVPLPDRAYEDWVAPHDLKDYGDVDETIYRQFFKSGYLRVEMNMCDQDGCIGKKVYYLADPDKVKGEGERFIFSQKAWEKYIQEKRK